jgi:hypothetical protein
MEVMREPVAGCLIRRLGSLRARLANQAQAARKARIDTEKQQTSAIECASRSCWCWLTG